MPTHDGTMSYCKNIWQDGRSDVMGLWGGECKGYKQCGRFWDSGVVQVKAKKGHVEWGWQCGLGEVRVYSATIHYGE